ncbi:MAG: hypothetical protein ACLGI3_14470 [Actinomycetes bacterium]
MERGFAVASARAVLGPALRSRGYSAGRRAGPGVEWTRTVDTGRFTVGIAAGPWDEVTGSRLTVAFGGDVLDLFHITFLEHLPAAVHPEWEALARSAFDRAVGLREAVADGNLVAVRRDLLQQELDGLEAGYLDAFGWPWFDEHDLTRWWEFVGRHFATGEAAAIADARERQDEDPVPEEFLAMNPAMVVAVPEDVAEQLWRHGEDELAVRMLDVDESTWEKVMATAAAPPEQVRRRRRASVDEALVHAAVEVLTGAARPLARKRRRPAGQLASFWARVGPERDLRRAGGADPLRPRERRPGPRASMPS